MKFGLGPYPADAADRYPAFLEHAALAEEEGFDSIWVDGGRQFSGGSPFPLGAAAARRTSVVRIGVRPNLGLVHPVYVAEDTAALDLISKGRVVLGLADSLPAQSGDAYGLAPGDFRERFWESVEVVHRAWAPEPFAHQGKHWKVPARLPEHALAAEAHQISVTPKPAQVSVPAWVATSNEASLARIVARGLPLLGEAWESRAELATKFRAYREAAGQSLAALVSPVVRDVHVAETTEEAWRQAEGPLAAQYGLYEEAGRLVAGNGGGARARAEGRAIVGDVDSVVHELRRYQEEMGLNYLICRVALPGMAEAAVRSSITLLARGVAPPFRMFNLPDEIRARTLEEADNPMIGYLRELS